MNGTQDGNETGTDCGGGTCPACPSGQGCVLDADCQSGNCNIVTHVCSAPTCNDVIKNGTETGIDCGGGTCPPCPPGQGCVVDQDCLSGVCNIATNVCSAPACNDLVKNGAETGIDCGGGTCPTCPNGQGCSIDADCQSAYCSGGTCAPKAANGAPCTGSNGCLSGQCVDTVCCNTSCGGTCQACNVPGSVGSCSNVPNGQDPANECAGSSACNGSGACGSPNGAACATGSNCLSAHCVDSVCCNLTCSGSCQACNLAGSLGTCSNIPAGQDPANECAGATTCSGAGSCAAFSNGTTCTISGECMSGSCIDGVCCNSSCTGLCKACNIAGSVGTCSNVPIGQDPANECAGTSTCNGSGACGP